MINVKFYLYVNTRWRCLSVDSIERIIRRKNCVASVGCLRDQQHKILRNYNKRSLDLEKLSPFDTHEYKAYPHNENGVTFFDIQDSTALKKAFSRNIFVVNTRLLDIDKISLIEDVDFVDVYTPENARP